jgi:hypothetical protein
MTEWFRRTTWTADDERDFFARLARSRGPARKAQYLRIQAVHLAEAQPPLHSQALRLLDQVLVDYPDDLMLAQVHVQRGASLVALGRRMDAATALRAALAAQRARPNVQTSAAIDFAWLVAVHDDLAPLRSEALAVLTDHSAETEAFPVSRYRRDGARAMLLAAVGDRAGASAAARNALTAAGQLTSGFRHHPKLGLVQSPDEKVHARIIRLAAT